MRVDVLGPLRVTSGGDVVCTPHAKERALLEALALRAGHAVPLVDLETALWGDEPPLSAGRSLQAHVAHLRRDLGPERITREAGGYRLDLDPNDVDATQMEILVAAGESAVRSDPPAARSWFGEAERLWRGEPLADLAETPERRMQVDRLAELWRQAREGRISADLRLGRHREVLAELRRIVAEDPMRESACALLMLALYRSGSSLEALRCYGQLRRDLHDEWGVEPSPELQNLKAQIQRQDSGLDLSPPALTVRVPAPTTPFVGRVGQVDAVAAAMRRSRLLTLHGPAGVGKSRLAQQVAINLPSGYSDGTWWVDLTPCVDAEAVARRLAEALGMPASPGLPLVDWIRTWLATREMLIILDNCEQVAGPLAEILGQLLAEDPRLQVIATSRVRLGVSGEVLWEVPPLDVPAPGADEEDIRSCDSVILFQQHLGPGREDDLVVIATICRALEGIPLALELIAARAAGASLAEIAAALPEELRTAHQAVVWPPHHVSVTHAIEWSYAHLPAHAQHLLDLLSVAPADIDSTAAVTLGAGAGLTAQEVHDALAILVDSSLVRVEVRGEQTRYQLLFVIREFGTDRLRRRGEEHAAHQGFADHFRDLCSRAGPELDGRHPGRWLRVLSREMTNVRAAVVWSMEHDPARQVLMFSHALGRVMWLASPDLAADAALLRRVVERAPDASADERAWGWVSLVTAAYLSGDIGSALSACEQASTLFEESGDTRGLAVLHWHWGAALLLARGDLPRARQHLSRGVALAQQAGAATAEAWCLAHLVQLAYFSGAVTSEDEGFQQRAEALADADDTQLRSHLGMNRSGLHLARGEALEAIAAAEWTERFSQRVHIPIYEQAALLMRAQAQTALGRAEESQVTSLRAARIALDAGNSMQMGVALLNLAGAAQADPVRAARLFGAGTSRAPLWPGFRASQYPEQAARALGDRFEAEVEAGRHLSTDEALELAIG